MAITYDVGNDIITVTGFTESVPGLLDDIYDADVAGGWGVVFKQDNAFKITCKLYIGDGSSGGYVKTEKEFVEFTKNAALTLYVQADGFLRMGSLDAYSEPYLGSVFKFVDYQNSQTVYIAGVLKMYDSALMMTGLASGNDPVWIGGTASKYSVIKRCRVLFETQQRFIPLSTYLEIDGLEVYNAMFLVSGTTPPTTWNDIFLLGPYTGLQKDFATLVVSGLKFSPAVTHPVATYYAIIYLIDPDWDETKITLDITTPTSELYIQFHFDLILTNSESTPIEGASVQLKDVDGNTVFSAITGADGKIPQQLYTYKYVYYNNVVKNYNPFRLIISKAGYETIDFKLTLDKKTALTIGYSKPYDIRLAIEDCALYALL
jgi:hypothetical protein